MNNENKANINWFPGHMAKSLKEIEDSLKLVDMIIEIIDARAPLASRNPQIVKYNKPRLIILSKKDLADQLVLNEWINYFKNESTNVISMDLNKNFNEKQIVNAINALLKEKIEKDLKRGIKNRRIRALVVGIPNVGKSTFINKLAHKKAAGVGNKPGFTRSLQWVNTANIDLLDTPGVLWPKFEDYLTGVKLALIGTIKEDILDTDTLSDFAIKFLINNYKDEFVKRYNLLDLDKEKILESICINRGLLLKNNVYNLNQAKYLILKELKEGVICKVCLESPSKELF
jgi:ribosome biogenesis GTPase A